MSYSLCFVGLGREDEAGPIQMLARAGGGRWQAAPEAEADVLIVDIDTMVGHMSWLKLGRDPRPVVVLSARPSGSARYSLQKPLDPSALAALLGQLESNLPAPAAPAPETAAGNPGAGASARLAPEPVSMPAPEPEKAAPPRPAVLLDFLVANRWTGPVRLDTPGAPLLVIDPKAAAFLGGDKLKPYAAHCTRPIADEQWRPVQPEALAALQAKLYGRQPLVRLRWLAGLMAGEGRLLPPLAAADRFKLTRWLQVEREFPKHFRIATAMMKSAQTVAEIAESSKSPEAEVADFINAANVIGALERAE